jgi:hypothetical protein
MAMMNIVKALIKHYKNRINHQYNQYSSIKILIYINVDTNQYHISYVLDLLATVNFVTAVNAVKTNKS